MTDSFCNDPFITFISKVFVKPFLTFFLLNRPSLSCFSRLFSSSRSELFLLQSLMPFLTWKTFQLISEKRYFLFYPHNPFCRHNSRNAGKVGSTIIRVAVWRPKVGAGSWPEWLIREALAKGWVMVAGLCAICCIDKLITDLRRNDSLFVKVKLITEN